MNSLGLIRLIRVLLIEKVRYGQVILRLQKFNLNRVNLLKFTEIQSKRVQEWIPLYIHTYMHIHVHVHTVHNIHTNSNIVMTNNANIQHNK